MSAPYYDDYNNSNNKLSWSLHGQGGYRAGNGILSESGDWYKIIFYKPYVAQNQPMTDNTSKYILDSASDGDSSCELGDALEISCQNFPRPINLYRDSVKQSTEKQIAE